MAAHPGFVLSFGLRIVRRWVVIPPSRPQHLVQRAQPELLGTLRNHLRCGVPGRSAGVVLWRVVEEAARHQPAGTSGRRRARGSNVRRTTTSCPLCLCV